MQFQIRLIVTALVVAGFAFANPAWAQQEPNKPTAGREAPVHCDSGPNGMRVYCGREHVHYSIESPSQPNCVKGKTWGSDDRGVWVSGGCNGDFDGQETGDR